MQYSIEKITTLIGARRIGTADAQIGWLLTDSRSLCFPEETLFFALSSPRNDGHKYIPDSIAVASATSWFPSPLNQGTLIPTPIF